MNIAITTPLPKPQLFESVGDKGHLLLVDDDEAVLQGLERQLVRDGYRVETAFNGADAINALKREQYDAVLSDISMPTMSGIELLRAIRGYDLDIPVLMMTGTPEVSTAVRALEYGALRYLIKPVDAAELIPTVDYAVRMCRMARVKREALTLLGDAEKFVGDRAGLETHFHRALQLLWMAYQPIVQWSQRRVFAFEALLRSSEPKLGNPMVILSAAEQLTRLPDLGGVIRTSIAQVAAQAQANGAKVFVNLHPLDLKDDRLFAKDAPLTKFASNVVLEITERASLDELHDVPQRLKTLREMGYQIALDDLGAGYAGLTSLAQLQPEVVKIDMSLVRDIDRSVTKQKLVGTMTTLARDMGMLVVVEGVETAAERDALLSLGCDYFQGYLFAKPGKPFPTVNW